MRKFWFILLALLVGCSITRVRPYHLTVSLTNDSNRLLTVEGETNLPEEAPIEAAIYEESGRRLLVHQTKVQDGSFFVLLELSKLAGYTPYRLEVAFDPLLASGDTTGLTGARGEAMTGDQVEFESGRYRLVEKFSLTLSGEGKALVQHHDPAVMVKQLEKLVEDNPEDLELKLQLALALLRWSESERRPGTRAHLLLNEVIATRENSTEAETAKMWIGRLEAEEKARRAEAALREDMAGKGRFVKRTRVVPGESLGAIRLGMPYRVLGRRFRPVRRPSFAGDGVATIEFKDFKGVSVGVDRQTRRVVWASSTDPFFRMDGGYGVGSLVQEVPGLKTPKFGPEETDDEGNRVSYGVRAKRGVEFTIERKKDPVTRFPIDSIAEIRVLPFPKGKKRR